MSLLDWINPIGKVIDLVDKAVPDKDLRAQMKHELAVLRENVYMAELNTKTIPWVDAVHKLGRQLLSWASLVIPAIILYIHPETDPLSLAAMTAPGGIYNYVKGKGR